MKKALSLIVVAALALWYVNCGDDKCKKDLNCACDNGMCNAGLKCENNVCLSCPEGSEDCACGASDACDEGLACYTYADNTKACRMEGLCCDDLRNIKIEGVAIDLAAQAPVGANVSAYSANVALTGVGDAASTTTSDATTGAFAFDCFDVGATAAFGIVILTDDDGDAYYPTFTGVMGLSSPETATCMLSPPGATVFALPTTLVTALGAIDGFNATDNGFVIGNVLDGDRQPLEGATVHVDAGAGNEPTDIADIVYLGFDAQGMPTLDNDATTATGLYVIKGDAPEIQAFPPPALVAKKDGYTFPGGIYRVSAIAGKGYYVPVVADPLP